MSVIEKLVTKLKADGRSHMWIVHFFDHDAPLPDPTNDELQDERNACHYCQLRAWTSNELYPVCIVNDVSGDTSCIDPNFQFIEENRVGAGVEFAEPEFLSGCDCKGRVPCKRDTCSCLQDLDAQNHQGKDVNPYYTEGPNSGCLKDWMLESRQPIYECTENCKCGAECPNRVVAAGRKINLQIFKTNDNRGWGLRPMEHIKKGQFVGKYVGELLSPLAASQRVTAAKNQGKKDIYRFALDKFYDPHSPDPRLASEPYEIDGEFYSGPTRFINHSCNPNLRVFAVVGDHANKPVHGLCFFALEDIESFTELTFDYVDGVDGMKDGAKPVKRGRPSKREIEEKESEGKQLCLCGATNCRMFLW